MVLKIPLTRGMVATVDDSDADLAAHKWHASKASENHNYAARSYRLEGVQHRVQMHRVVAARTGEIGPGLVVDHINGDTLDNRRENLRIVTQQVNIRNRRGACRTSVSGIRGVRFYRPLQKWAASISVREEGRPNGQRTIHLGYFATAEEATAARKAGEERLWGDQC